MKHQQEFSGQNFVKLKEYNFYNERSLKYNQSCNALESNNNSTKLHGGSAALNSNSGRARKIPANNLIRPTPNIPIRGIVIKRKSENNKEANTRSTEAAIAEKKK